jgi:hypothetical protein
MRASDTAYAAVTKVTVKMDSAEFLKMKRQGQFGQLFGIDISNEVYRLSGGAVHASHPSVDFAKRASNGIKWITLKYFQDDIAKANAMGFECLKVAGKLVPKYSASIDFPPSFPKLAVANA